MAGEQFQLVDVVQNSNVESPEFADGATNPTILVISAYYLNSLATASVYARDKTVTRSPNHIHLAMNDSRWTAEEGHMVYMRQALDEALSDDCIPVQTAFCVGCILVARIPGMEPITLATGYSRELPGNTHAEANALTKVFDLSEARLAALFPSASPTPSVPDLLRHTDVYTTLEPCSVRTSGLPACADALVKAGIKRCIIGAGEPGDFVKCEGAQKLRDAGIRVVWLDGLEKECLDAARRGHHTKG